MDPLVISVMIFSLVVLMLLGSFALIWPLSRQLVALIRKRIHEPSPRDSITREDAEKLAQAIQQLATGMEALNERQEFLEQLLEGRSRGPRELPPGGGGS